MLKKLIQKLKPKNYWEREYDALLKHSYKLETQLNKSLELNLKMIKLLENGNKK